MLVRKVGNWFLEKELNFSIKWIIGIFGDWKRDLMWERGFLKGN